MSLEDARNKLTAARNDFTEGRKNAVAGQEVAHTVLSRYATASEHRAGLARDGERLRSYLEMAQGAIATYTSQTKRAAKLQQNIYEPAQTATTHYSMANLHGGLATAQLAVVFGEREAHLHTDPCTTHATRAAMSANFTSIRAQSAEDLLQQYASRLAKLAKELGDICVAVDQTTYAIDHAHELSDSAQDSFKMSMSLDDLNHDAAADPASMYEEGDAAVEAFDGALQTVGRHLRNIS